MMRKRLLFALLFLLVGALPACASSMLYTFSSGDILLTNANPAPTYGLGRIDFDEITGEPVPTVILSGDNRQHALGEFTRNNQRYIYDSKVRKPIENITYYDVYNATSGIDNKLVRDFTINVNLNPIASCDLTLAPDAQGYIYAIQDNNILTRYDMLNWGGTVTARLETGYNVYSLVGLTNNANFVYVWCSQRSAINADGLILPKKAIFTFMTLSQEIQRKLSGLMKQLTRLHIVL